MPELGQDVIKKIRSYPIGTTEVEIKEILFKENNIHLTEVEIGKIRYGDAIDRLLKDKTQSTGKMAEETMPYRTGSETRTELPSQESGKTELILKPKPKLSKKQRLAAYIGIPAAFLLGAYLFGFALRAQPAPVVNQPEKPAVEEYVPVAGNPLEIPVGYRSIGLQEARKMYPNVLERMEKYKFTYIDYILAGNMDGKGMDDIFMVGMSNANTVPCGKIILSDGGTTDFNLGGDKNSVRLLTDITGNGIVEIARAYPKTVYVDEAGNLSYHLFEGVNPNGVTNVFSNDFMYQFKNKSIIRRTDGKMALWNGRIFEYK
ncbi:MAG: hypothetical protein V1900_01800 [Candidatus Aenigmatarchaeota archaeon]